MNSSIREEKSISIKPVNRALLVIVIILAIFMLFAIRSTNVSYNEVLRDMDRFVECQNSAISMQKGSDYLTLCVRNYVSFGDRADMDDYFNEVHVVRSRDEALGTIEKYFADTAAYRAIENSLAESNDLMKTEHYAMRLAAEGRGDTVSLPQEVADVILTDGDVRMSAADKLAKAHSLVYGAAYQERKSAIETGVNDCLNSLIAMAEEENSSSTEAFRGSLRQLIVGVLLLLVVMFVIVLLARLFLISPLINSTKYIAGNKAIPESGSTEMRTLVRTYNLMFEQSKDYQDKLSYEANHDPLTGILNRGAFESAKTILEHGSAALLMIDIDNFKQFNDSFGHDVGDAVLRRLADALRSTFRLGDYVCRIGGDEFAVIVMHVDPSMKPLIVMKIKSISAAVRKEKDGVPGCKVSFGVAFSDGKKTGDEIFKQADETLYRIKESGKDGYAFYGEEIVRHRGEAKR